MNTIYHVTLVADMHPSEPTQFEGRNSEWRHCANTLEAIANFVTQILHKREDFGHVVCLKLAVARYVDCENNGFFGWEGDCEISIKDLNMYLYKHEDYENLYNFVLEQSQNFNFNIVRNEQGIYDNKWNLCYQEFIEFE